jgi:hypothetical protein
VSNDAANCAPCNGGEYCACKKEPRKTTIFTNELPPWPTLEEIRKAVRDELRAAGVRT